ncbi:MAG: hypothetical protein ACOCTT_00815 [archaeon]
MNLKETNEKDKNMKEIENTLEDIESFRKGNYKKIISKKDIDMDKIKEITEKTGVSKVTATEILGDHLLKKKED